MQCFKRRLLTGLVSGAFIVATSLGLMPVTAAASDGSSGHGLLVPVLSDSTKLVTDALTTLTNGNTDLALDGSNTSPDENSLNLSLGGVTVDISNDTTVCPNGGVGIPPHCLPASNGGSGWSTLRSHSAVKGAETDIGNPAGSDKQTRASAGLTVSNKLVAYTKAVIHVASQQATKVYVRFGLNGALTTTTPASGYAKTHDVVIDSKHLVPGSTYSYQIVSTTQDGKRQTSPIETFTTKGFTVYVTVLDKDHHPLRNKTVTLHSTAMTATTDANGIVKFDNVAPGMHHLEYDTGGKKHSETVTVGNNVTIKNGKQIADAQHVSVIYEDLTQPVTRERAIWSLLVVETVVVIGLIAWLWHRRRADRRARKSAAWAAKAVFADEPEKADKQ